VKRKNNLHKKLKIKHKTEHNHKETTIKNYAKTKKNCAEQYFHDSNFYSVKEISLKIYRTFNYLQDFNNYQNS